MSSSLATSSPATLSSVTSSLALWRDARGRLSWLRIATLTLLVWPLVLANVAWQNEISSAARPINDLIHRAGFWMLMFVLLSLAVTPLRRIARYPQLVDVRRMIGVGAFCYGFTHISLYTFDLAFDFGTVATEIVARIYLTIGFTALLGLTVLAATSTDGMVRDLGGLRWRKLHQLIYLIGVLGLIHFFQQTKLDETIPTLFAGLFTWLIGYRLIAGRWNGPGEIPSWVLLVLGLAASALTFVGEAIGIAIKFNVSPIAVLQTVLDFDVDNLDMVRPGWYVLAIGLCIVILDLACARWRQRKPRQRAPARTPAKEPVKAPARETA